jgi:hypothetical protein
MVLRHTSKFPKHPLFYGCSTWPTCTATHGAHADGTPLGIPADKVTKAARIKAHDAFDKLWQGGQMRRVEAYTWMQRVMGMTKEQAHIGRFTKAECEKLEGLANVYCQAFLPGVR